MSTQVHRDPSTPAPATGAAPGSTPASVPVPTPEPAEPAEPRGRSVVDEVRAVARSASEAGGVLRITSDEVISAALRAAADHLGAAASHVLDVNAHDVEAAEAAGTSPALIDRLRLTPERLVAGARALRELAELPVAPGMVKVRDLPGGEGGVYERRLPVGVIGATYEARPAVTLDVAGQVLRARSAAVLRTGSAALGSSSALVDAVLAPALADAGLPAAAVSLVRQAGHEAAEALVTQGDLLPLVIVRGSGSTTRRLSALGAAAGVRVLAHADGGGVMYVDSSADPAVVRRLVRAGVDRLGVCNRLNLLLIEASRWEELSALVAGELAEVGVRALLPPHTHQLGHEWALDDGREANVTLAPVDGPLPAAALAAEATSGIAATVVAEDPQAASAFLAAWPGTGGFWNTTTRLLDGYKLLGVPETGISVDRVPGPRGPVTGSDLVLRQYVVLPDGPDAGAVHDALG